MLEGKYIIGKVNVSYEDFGYTGDLLYGMAVSVVRFTSTIYVQELRNEQG